jgi:hypothetical protein
MEKGGTRKEEGDSSLRWKMPEGRRRKEIVH